MENRWKKIARIANIKWLLFYFIINSVNNDCLVDICLSYVVILIKLYRINQREENH